MPSPRQHYFSLLQDHSLEFECLTTLKNGKCRKEPNLKIFQAVVSFIYRKQKIELIKNEAPTRSKWNIKMYFKKEGKRKDLFSMTSARKECRRVLLKAVPGRGTKQIYWVVSLHGSLLEEFNRIQSLSVKFNTSSLKAVALNLIIIADDILLYCSSVVHGGKSLSEAITIRSVQRFMLKKNFNSFAER